MEFDARLLATKFVESTGCNTNKAQEQTSKYLRLCVLDILKNLNFEAEKDFCNVSLDHLFNSMGSIQVNGTRYYGFKVFQSFPERILSPVHVGDNIRQKLTMATINYKLEDLMIATGDAVGLIGELYEPYAKDIERGDVDYAPIDMNSLKNFIIGNERSPARDKDNTAMINTLDYNLKHARRIHIIAEASGNVLPQVVNESSFGRRYYKGPNLQNTPKVVRHAALGHCHEYDIESSVFTWKFTQFKQICNWQNENIAMPATLEYLDHKTAMRKRLARQIFNTDEDWALDVIKQAITALGFGAPLRTTGHITGNGAYETTALNKIITAKTKLQAFVDDTWIKEFAREQTNMNNVIIEMQKMSGLEKHWRTIPDLVDSANRLKPNSVISWCYQQAERAILEWFIERCAASEVLLTVHDCVYTRRSIPLADVRWELRDRYGPFYNIGHQHHFPYAYDTEEAEHKQRIQQEENEAAEFFGTIPRQVDIGKTKFKTSTPPGHLKDIYDGGAVDEMASVDAYDRDFDPFYMDGDVE